MCLTLTAVTQSLCLFCSAAGDDDRQRGLQPIDIVLIAVVALAALVGVLVLLKKMCTKVWANTLSICLCMPLCLTL